MQDLTAEQQKYINENGISGFNDKYPDTVATLSDKSKLSKVFLQAFHINWLKSMLGTLYSKLTTIIGSFESMFQYKGVYDENIQYHYCNTVTYEGVTYVCLRDCKGVSLITPNYWARITGATGATGIRGATGNNGVDGKDAVQYYLSANCSVILNDGSNIVPSEIIIDSYKSSGSIKSAYTTNFKMYYQDTSEVWKLQASYSNADRLRLDSGDFGKDYSAIKIESLDVNNSVIDTVVLPFLDVNDIMRGSHSHNLEDDNITGVLPVSKGGTGGTSPSVARWKIGSNGRNTFVIASEDSTDDYKVGADLILPTVDTDGLLNDCINDLADGFKIVFMPGNYGFDNSIILNKSIALEGLSHLVRFGILNDVPLFEIGNTSTISNVTIHNIYLQKTRDITHTTPIIQASNINGLYIEKCGLNMYYDSANYHPNSITSYVKLLNECVNVVVEKCVQNNSSVTDLVTSNKDKVGYMIDCSKCNLLSIRVGCCFGKADIYKPVGCSGECITYGCTGSIYN